jgi:branched-chain amino acid transport system substrate-binding protein
MKKQLVIAAFGALMTAGFVSQVGAQSKVINLGWSGAITGPTSDAGSKYGLGVGDYCKWANEKQPIAGYTLKCETRDDNYDNSKTQRNLEDFAQNLKVSGFLGYSTGGTLQIRSLLRELQMPAVTGTYHAGLLEGPDGDYVFLPISSYSEQLVSLVEYVKNLNPSAKIAFVANPSPFGRLPVEDGKKAAIKLGLDVVATDEVGAGNLDNTALLKRYESLGVTHIIHQNTYGPVSNIVKDAKRLGLDKKITQLGAHYAGGDDLINLAGPAAENFLWTTGFWLYDEANQPGMQIIREMAKLAGRPETDASSIHYTAGTGGVAIMVEAARRAVTAKQDVTNKTIYEQLLKMNKANAYASPFSISKVDYTADDHTGSRNLRLFQAKKGKWVVVTPSVVSKLFKQIHPGR